MKKQITMTELNMIQTHLDAIYGILGLTVRVTTQEYKAKSKSQLADAAGVSRRTLSNWLSPFEKELKAMGVVPTSKVFPPSAVAFICEKLCIVM